MTQDEALAQCGPLVPAQAEIQGNRRRLRIWHWIPACAGMSAVFVAAFLLLTPVLAASDKQPPPPGALKDAPPQYTRFTARELTRGFLALAFGSDLHVGARPQGIRRFDHPIRVAIIAGGSVDRVGAMRRVVEDYARQVASLQLGVAPANEPADVEVRLIDQRAFKPALMSAFGAQVTDALYARLTPQCITKVESNTAGQILRAVSFVIVDKGETAFRDCAYHELLHAFGLANHDQRNPWTTLNQRRVVGYLTVYDRALLAILYERRIRPGMDVDATRATLPDVVRDLGLAAGSEPK